MSMRYRIVTVTPLMQNCSVVWCPSTKVAAVIDPGGEPERILETLREGDLTVACVLLTHGHIDHVGSAGSVAEHTNAPIWGPGEADEFLIESLDTQAELFGVPLERPFRPDRWLHDGDRVTLGGQELEVLHCPGHTPGHVVFYCRTQSLLFTGDVLFRGSIGRTDLPGGDHGALLASINRRLLPLDDETAFVPGHGPEGTLGEERRTNPFLR